MCAYDIKCHIISFYEFPKCLEQIHYTDYCIEVLCKDNLLKHFQLKPLQSFEKIIRGVVLFFIISPPEPNTPPILFVSVLIRNPFKTFLDPHGDPGHHQNVIIFFANVNIF